MIIYSTAFSNPLRSASHFISEGRRLFELDGSGLTVYYLNN